MNNRHVHRPNVVSMASEVMKLILDVSFNSGYYTGPALTLHLASTLTLKVNPQTLILYARP